MLWFFDRRGESLRLETRYENETSEFVAIIHYPDGRKRQQRFVEMSAFQLWLEELEQDLATEQWMGRSGPVILPYGWPNRSLT